MSCSRLQCVEGVLTVQPTKRACWQLHMSEHSMPDIARLRGIRLETVLSYLAECVRAGMGYRWCVGHDDGWPMEAPPLSVLSGSLAVA